MGSGVNQDVVDGVVFEQLLEGAEAKDFVEDFLGDAVALHGAERNALFGDDLLNEGEELELAGAGFLGLAELLEVEAVDEFGMDSGLEFLLFLLAQGTGIGRGGAQSGTVGAEVVAVGTCLREVEREITHRYSVLFWPNKEKPLRAGWVLTAASSPVSMEVQRVNWPEISDFLSGPIGSPTLMARWHSV